MLHGVFRRSEIGTQVAATLLANVLRVDLRQPVVVRTAKVVVVHGEGDTRVLGIFTRRDLVVAYGRHMDRIPRDDEVRGPD